MKYPGNEFKMLCYMLSQPDAAPEEVLLTSDYTLEPGAVEQVRTRGESVRGKGTQG